MRSNVDKDDLYSNWHSKTSYDVTVILKNNKFCGSKNISELKNWKLELELHSLASNLLAQSVFVKCDDC